LVLRFHFDQRNSEAGRKEQTTDPAGITLAIQDAYRNHPASLGEEISQCSL
jgi:hypothetical protein